MKFGVIVFPGANCDHDMFHALKKVMGEDVAFIWHQEVSLREFDAVVLPGGFSYGDYLRVGAVARFSPILKEVVSFARQGKKVLGICNGFQILTECGLLPGAFMRNKNLRFVCKNVFIRTENKNTAFTNTLFSGQVLKIPIAHGEGNYFIEESGLKELQDNQQIVFRYSSVDGDTAEIYNPNGSLDNIAALINREGNVLGMMPHPERAMEALLNSTDGRFIFESMRS